MVKNRVKTVNIGEGHLKRRNITRSWTRFKALICAVLTSKTGLRAPDILAFKATPDNIYCFYIDFSPLIHEVCTVLCDSGLVRTAQMRAFKPDQEHVIFRHLRWPLPIFTVLTRFFTINWWILDRFAQFWPCWNRTNEGLKPDPRAPNISTFKVTSTNIYCFYTHFSPIIGK